MNNPTSKGKAKAFFGDNYVIESQNVQSTQYAHEPHMTHEIRNERTSSSRKQKHPRMNMAFYDDNLDYVRDVAWENRMSATQYINYLIEQDREQKGR